MTETINDYQKEQIDNFTTTLERLGLKDTTLYNNSVPMLSAFLRLADEIPRLRAEGQEIENHGLTAVVLQETFEVDLENPARIETKPNAVYDVTTLLMNYNNKPHDVRGGDILQVLLEHIIDGIFIVENDGMIRKGQGILDSCMTKYLRDHKIKNDADTVHRYIGDTSHGARRTSVLSASDEVGPDALMLTFHESHNGKHAVRGWYLGTKIFDSTGAGMDVSVADNPPMIAQMLYPVDNKTVETKLPDTVAGAIVYNFAAYRESNRDPELRTGTGGNI
jgi:hypothetical protein